VRLADAKQTLGIGEEELRLLIRVHRLRIGPSTGAPCRLPMRRFAEVSELLGRNGGSLARYVDKPGGVG
jgi:hypothetical protein